MSALPTRFFVGLSIFSMQAMQRASLASRGTSRPCPADRDTPTLLAFCAENPIRNGRLPETIVEATRAILEARPDIEQIHHTLALVSSGRIARECHVQVPLIDLLCDQGAIPDRALEAAVAHGEFAAVEALLRRGARHDIEDKVFEGTALGWAEHGQQKEVAVLRRRYGAR